MRTPVETFDSAAAFLAAQKAPRRKSSAPGVPRAPAGVGDRHAALDRLSQAGYGGITYVARTDEFYCIGPSGECPRASTYHAAIDAALAMVKAQNKDHAALPAVTIDRTSTHETGGKQ